MPDNCLSPPPLNVFPGHIYRHHGSKSQSSEAAVNHFSIIISVVTLASVCLGGCVKSR